MRSDIGEHRVFVPLGSQVIDIFIECPHENRLALVLDQQVCFVGFRVSPISRRRLSRAVGK